MQLDKQTQIDAAILMKHTRNRDTKGLRTIYEEMRGHGGKERIERAEALIIKMRSTEDQPQATLQLASKTHQEAQTAERRQEEIDAVELLKKGKGTGKPWIAEVLRHDGRTWWQGQS